MGIGGIWQWVIVLIIVGLLFGTKRLKNMGSDLGAAVKGFKKGVKSDPENNAQNETAKVVDQDNDTTNKSEVANDK